MDYDALVAKVIELLQREKRVPYRSLKRRFELNDDYIDDLKIDLIEAKRLAIDENDRILVWIGEASAADASTPPPASSRPEPAAASAAEQERDPLSYTPKHLAEKILTSRSALEGERKQVTVLFCDLANSTPLAERLGPEHMHTLLNRFFELALSEVHRYEGTINQFLGDGFMALFGAPVAHEDHARRAVFAALALQRALQEADVGKPYGEACQFRMGLDSGLVVVGSIGDNLRMDYSAIGDTTNLAARLQQHATPGDILVSGTTARLVRGSILLEALPPVQVKGKTEPVPIYTVRGTLPRRSPIANRSERTLSPFVGRGHELAVLDDLLEQGEQGQGQVVGIVAEAGGGKSRLLYEFRQRLHNKRVTYVEGRCLSYGNTIPYHPIIDVLRNHCGITETDDPEAIADKVRFVLQEVGMEAEGSAPYLLQLLGVQEGTESLAHLRPDTIRLRTFDTLRQLSLKGSQQRPLIVEIEDLHWIDHTSQDYLASFVESLPGAAMLLLTSYRPGYRPPWIEKSYATQVSLHPLTSQNAVTIVHATHQQQALPEHLEHMILDKAQGNPFFLEELTHAIIEHGDLQKEVVVPDTIQGVLSARIDRLPEAHKRLLQTASVLGREFAPRLLQTLWEETAPLDPLLLDLKRLEFLYERARGEEPVYVFKHALTQDVTYDSLLTTRRQVLHVAAGQAMERLYPDGLAERSEALAHHFTLGAVWDKAFVSLVWSGEKARQAYANQEALTFYTQAIEVSGRITPALDDARLLPVYEGRGRVWQLMSKGAAAIADFERMHQIARASGQPRQEAESLCRLAYAHYHTHAADHLPLAEHYAQEAQQWAQRLGDAKLLAQSLDRLGAVEQWRGNMEEAERKLAASLQISHRDGDKAAISTTLMNLGRQAYWQGNFQPAIHFAQEGMTVARDLHEGFDELLCLAFLNLACWSQGDYAEAFRLTHDVMTKARELHNMVFVGRMQNTLGWFFCELGALSQAAECNRESADLGRTIGLANVEISACINLGLDYLALGQPTRALAYLAPTLDRVTREAYGSHRWRFQIRLFTGLAELSYTTGAYDDALRYVEEGLQEAQRTSSQKYVALGWALRGKIIAKLGDTVSAGTELQRAFSLAEQLQSPSLLYPIAYDLGQWYESTGKERDAAALYGKAKATIAQMATAVEDEALRSTFLQSALVQEIHERAARLGE